ncbi:MAG: sugar phosphate isomerase family [Planctomycetota bacterium]|jgi:hypothetical protein
MSRFGYLAVEKFGYVTGKQLNVAFQEQWSQDCARPSEGSDPLGKILVDKGFLSREQRDEILEVMLMEPNISWGEETYFARTLQIEKGAKQALGDYVGKRLSEEPSGITIFLSNSSTIYYIFRGLVKHAANLNVLTIHAAILAAYPSVRSKIRSVRTIWNGRVDLDNALIEPDDLNDPHTKAELGFLHGDVTHAVISATGFDCTYGPMADNATAREVARKALQSETHTCVIIDHTKVRVGTRKNQPSLLFRGNEWKEIRDRGDLDVCVTCHPKMPAEQACLGPAQRSSAEIRRILQEGKVAQPVIDEVLRYQEWAMRLRAILREVPF